MPRPQSLAIVLGVFKLNYQAKRDKRGNGKGTKKKESKWFTFPSFIKNLEKACTRDSAVNTEACDVIHLIFSSNALSIGYTCSLPLYVKGRLCSESKLKSCYYYTMVTILYI